MVCSMFCNCLLQKIDGLKHLPKLEKLFLYSNNISKIENIEYLLNLHTLWLNDNKISDIEVSRFLLENLSLTFSIIILSEHTIFLQATNSCQVRKIACSCTRLLIHYGSQKLLSLE